MKNSKQERGNAQFRQLLVREAARLMYEENIKQYHTAKWRAAKNLLSRGGIKMCKVRTRDLPSNGEISLAVYQMAQMHEGGTLTRRLFSMRITALDIMENLASFSPRLIGSVSTGRIKKTSDIDFHIFTDSLEVLENRLEQLSWDFEKETVTIRSGGKFREFTHLYVDHEFPMELSVYPANEIRARGRSSTDGKPIDRLSYERLLGLIEEQHADAWYEYLEFGDDSASAN